MRRGRAAVLVVLLLLEVALVLVAEPLIGEHRRVALGDEVVAVTVNTSSLQNEHIPAGKARYGKYVGHNELSNLEPGMPAEIHVAVDQPRYVVYSTCTHELEHHRLAQRNVGVWRHHDVMNTPGFNEWNPLQWDVRCLQLR